MHKNIKRHPIYQFKLLLRNTKHFNYTTFILYKYFSAKNNKIVFNKTTGPTFNFEAINIHHHSCPSSYNLPDDQNKTTGLHIIIHIKQNMVVESCVGNYATYDGLVNGADGIFKISTSYHNKTIVWILFPNPKIRMLTKEKSTHLYINNIQSNWTPIESIIKDIKIGKNQSHIITRI